MILLGVNIDHIATVRQARRTHEPDPVHAASLAELGGADQITVHLREDRRHIQDRDVRLLRETVTVPLNLEMALADEMVAHALAVKPYQACLVPERREEVTTEGGLDVIGQRDKVRDTIDQCHAAGVRVSCFIDPDPSQVAASIDLGADAVELHTGEFANAWAVAHLGSTAMVSGPTAPVAETIARVIAAGRAVQAASRRVDCNLGHGLTYRNLPALLMPVLRSGVSIYELNIGHSIVSRAMLIGLTAAVREMKQLIATIESTMRGHAH